MKSVVNCFTATRGRVLEFIPRSKHLIFILAPGGGLVFPFCGSYALTHGRN
jgi:hypothetical protein